MTRFSAIWTGVKSSIRRAVRVGFAATLTMDAAMVAAEVLGRDALSSPRLSPATVGRWAADLRRGVTGLPDVLVRPRHRGEAMLGVLTHYATGITLAAVFVAIPGGRRPTLERALGFGIATSALPLLVMFPSMGYGCFGRRTDEAPRLIRVMLLGHAAFGLGLGIAAGRNAGGLRPSSSR